MGLGRLSALVLTLGLLLAGLLATGCTIRVSNDQSRVARKPSTPAPIAIPSSVTPVPLDRYLSIEEINAIEAAWAREAPGLVELGTIGSTAKGTAIPYLRFGRTGPEILIHAAVHGNERIPVSCILGFMERLLREYGRDVETTALLNSRQVYFVPILSVDSYVSRQRHVEGVDPNRSYISPEDPNHNSPSPVAALQRWAEGHRFRGYISGHSVGRIYLWPRVGDLREKSAAMAKEMGQLSGYDAGSIGGSRGYDIDWGSWKLGAVSVLIEFGQGSHEMSPSILSSECERNVKPLKLFIRKCPEVNP